MLFIQSKLNTDTTKVRKMFLNIYVIATINTICNYRPLYRINKLYTNRNETFFFRLNCIHPFEFSVC